MLRVSVAIEEAKDKVYKTNSMGNSFHVVSFVCRRRLPFVQKVVVVLARSLLILCLFSTYVLYTTLRSQDAVLSFASVSRPGCG